MCRGKNCGPGSSFEQRLSRPSEGQVRLPPQGLLLDTEQSKDMLGLSVQMMVTL